uniref:Uncharacterized protein n=1 Tax=Ditylum brightwellii TaxID=49249 RepID=A0A7S1ZPY8_9STRA|mmetsp:Transcript_35967/g.53622  ORF Transcript_35967/g.53622 Transcript_35967/m.53622 type:complete len:386 (+) Transcript_35967:115-1272(+)
MIFVILDAKKGDEDADEKETEDEDDNDDNSDDEEEEDENNQLSKPTPTSLHSIQSKKLEEQTAEIEKEMLAEKPWQMTGETKGTARPVNSLLEAAPEFEVATKMAPTITVEHTENLEEMIKRRILAEDWDDVAPRELPDIGIKKNGELPEVSQEKSKLGLGELYEREYLKKATGYDPDAAEKQSEEDKLKGEMKMIFASLCGKLDALSNYHFTPRPVGDEAEVRAVTVPAIAMEEVMPLHVSDARGAAPEEIYGKKRGRDSVIRGESEMDQTERKRLRNAKKSARRKARKEKLADEKLISRLQPGLGLNNPYEKRKMREELSMARASGKVTTGEIDMDANFNTSAKFFQKMQENVQDEIRGESDGGKKSKGGLSDEVLKSSALKL